MSIESPQRIAKADRLQASVYGPQVVEHRPPYITPRRPETEPIERFSDEQFGFLIDKLLEDWDSPTLSELGLCRAHSITLEELDAITDDDDFQRALALVRRIRAKRQEERQAAAHAAVFDRLLRLVSQTSDTTTATKEVRLACKQLTDFMSEGGTARRAVSSAPAHDEPAERGASSPPIARRAMSLLVEPTFNRPSPRGADSHPASPVPLTPSPGSVFPPQAPTPTRHPQPEHTTSLERKISDHPAA